MSPKFSRVVIGVKPPERGGTKRHARETELLFRYRLPAPPPTVPLDPKPAAEPSAPAAAAPPAAVSGDPARLIIRVVISLAVFGLVGFAVATGTASGPAWGLAGVVAGYWLR
jgi:hypothetical protein